MKTYGFVRGRSSQALIGAIIVLALVLTVGVALHLHSRALRDFSSLQVDTDQAYFLAESGIGIAESFIASAGAGNPCIDLSSFDQTYNLGQGTIRIQMDESTGTIISTGKAGRSVRVLRNTFVPPPAAEVGEWAYAYGGSDGDGLYSLQQTSDGGYILGGGSYSFVTGSFAYNFLAIKTNPDGEVGAAYPGTWAYGYGGSGSSARDVLYSLQQTGDGGYILGGATRSFGSVSDFLLIKTDSDGNVDDPAVGDPNTWAYAYGGTSEDQLYSLQIDNGNYILGGKSDSFMGGGDFLVIKTDSNGNVIWAYTYGGLGPDELRSLQQASDGGYILGGFAEASFGNAYEFLVIKTDSTNGTVIWAYAYGGSGTGEDKLRSLQIDSGNYILLGGTSDAFTPSPFDGSDFLVIKTNSDGKVGAAYPGTWAYGYGGSDGDGLYSLRPTADGGYILGGTTYSFGAGGADFLVIKTDSQGRVGASAEPGIITWAYAYGGSNDDELRSLQRASDGGYILGGSTESFGQGSPEPGGPDFLAIKIDASGGIVCCDPAETLVTVTDATTQAGWHATVDVTTDFWWHDPTDAQTYPYAGSDYNLHQNNALTFWSSQGFPTSYDLHQTNVIPLGSWHPPLDVTTQAGWAVNRICPSP